MKLTIFNSSNDDTFLIDVSESTTIDVIRLQISSSKNINYNLIAIYVRGEHIKDMQLTVGKLNLVDMDLITIQLRELKRPQTNTLESEAANLVQKGLTDPQFLNNLFQSDPALAQAIASEDPINVTRLLQQRKNMIRPQNNSFNQQGGQFLQNNTSSMTNQQFGQYGQNIPNSMSRQQFAQPYYGNHLNTDPEMQKKIEEQIRIQRLNQLQNMAYENYPELFIQTQMLFITGKVNKFPTEIFVDTGAQVTIISKAFAERSGILKDVDNRYAGIVKGVGTQYSLGKLYMVEVFIGDRCFVISATVLEKFDHDVLLGLDMMKKHRCLIDLQNNEIRFGLEKVCVKFLSDHEISELKIKKENETIKRFTDITGANSGDAIRFLQENELDFNKAIESFNKNAKK